MIRQIASKMFDIVFSQLRQLLPCSSSTILLPRIVQCKINYANKTGVKETRRAVKQYNCFTFQYRFVMHIRNRCFLLTKEIVVATVTMSLT